MPMYLLPDSFAPYANKVEPTAGVGSIVLKFSYRFFWGGTKSASFRKPIGWYQQDVASCATPSDQNATPPSAGHPLAIASRPQYHSKCVNTLKFGGDPRVSSLTHRF